MRRVAENACLLSFPGESEEAANRRVLLADRAVRASAPAGLVDSIPAARTLLVTGDVDPEWLETLERETSAMEPDVYPSSRPAREIEVTPDGADLPDLLLATGLSHQDFWTLLGSLELRVGFLGFAPGFAYLYGTPPGLHLPRRSSPRPRIPKGSLALAGPYAGIYPCAMPGGWNLIGTTTLELFDPSLSPPCLLLPGDAVRFRLVS